ERGGTIEDRGGTSGDDSSVIGRQGHGSSRGSRVKGPRTQRPEGPKARRREARRRIASEPRSLPAVWPSYRLICVTVLPRPAPMTVHSALMSCLPPATFSRSASLSSPSGAAYGITTWTVSAVSATALTLTLPRLVLSCFSMMPFGSLSSASRYFGFSAANLPTRSCTSPRLIDCDIVVSSQVGVRYISSSVAPCPATLRFDAALQEQPAG